MPNIFPVPPPAVVGDSFSEKKFDQLGATEAVGPSQRVGLVNECLAKAERNDSGGHSRTLMAKPDPNVNACITSLTVAFVRAPSRNPSPPIAVAELTDARADPRHDHLNALMDAVAR